MCRSIDEIVDALASAVSTLDPAQLAPDTAARLVDALARAERISAAGRTLAAGRVLETRTWRATGYRTPAEWLASRTQSTLSDAISSLQTAHGLSSLPATRDAFAAGALSSAQAAEITLAAAADPAAETALLESAGRSTVAELRERCRAVRAAAAADESADERIRQGRYLRHWTDGDGAVRLHARFAPGDGAAIVAAVTAEADDLASDARTSGHREPLEAYKADALLSLCIGSSGARAVVQVIVDEAAFERGKVAAGETCVIPGTGPVSVTTARRLARSGTMKILERKGVEVTRVAHARRAIPTHVRTALEARDPACVVPGCDARRALEIDHIVPLAEGGLTRLDNLARLCRFHHAQKTHHGWRLGGRPGAWTWTRRLRREESARGP